MAFARQLLSEVLSHLCSDSLCFQTKDFLGFEVFGETEGSRNPKPETLKPARALKETLKPYGGGVPGFAASMAAPSNMGTDQESLLARDVEKGLLKLDGFRVWSLGLWV